MDKVLSADELQLARDIVSEIKDRNDIDDNEF